MPSTFFLSCQFWGMFIYDQGHDCNAKPSYELSLLYSLQNLQNGWKLSVSFQWKFKNFVTRELLSQMKVINWNKCLSSDLSWKYSLFLGRQATTDTSQSTQCSRRMHATSTVLNSPNLLELHWPPQEFCCSLLCLVYLVAHQSSSTLHRANFFPFHIFYIIHEKSWSLTMAK